MARFSLIDTTTLSNMQVVAVPDQEVILSDRMKRFVELWASYDPPMGGQYDVGNLEFDPAKIIQEASTSFQVNVLNRVNQAARAVTLAFASGTDLDAIASRYPGGVPRVSSEIYAPTAPITERMLKDARYRDRIWLSPNALAAAGTPEAYEFFAKTALPEARDVSATALRTPQEVVAVLTVLMEGDQPIPTQDQLLTIQRAIQQDDIMPLTDVLAVRPAIPIDFPYNVDVWLYPWADLTTLLGYKDDSGTFIPGEIEVALRAKLAELLWLDTDHDALTIGTALKQHGVHSAVVRDFPASGAIEVGPTQFVRVPSVNIVYRGRKK